MFCWVFVHWAQIAQFLGQLWGQNCILAISAFVAIWTISSSSRHEKRRATVDIVRDQTRDPELKASRESLRKLRDTKFDFTSLLSDQSSAPFLAVRDVLNAYEFMASGLREGAFDELVYKRMYYTNVVRDWDLLTGFVAGYRTSRGNTLYQDFQWLAGRWKKKKLKADS